MFEFDEPVELESLFGKVSVIYIPKSEVATPEGWEEFEKAFDFEKNNAYQYEATFIDGLYKNSCATGLNRETAIKALMSDVAVHYGYQLFPQHIADLQTKDIKIGQRQGVIMADGSALWLDVSGNKLERRKFTAGEKGVLLNLEEPVTRKRCADICAQYDIKRLSIHDDRFYHPDNGAELSMDWIDENAPEGGYIVKKRQYIYYAKSDTLQIWVDDYPVSEDAAGIICDDPDALADCLL
jgi:hypothetical protein